jgi:hypothetical protein
MPRLNVNYDNTVIYKIACNDLNIKDCYVGSTTDFTKRKYSHKSACNNENIKNYNLKVYKMIRNNGGWDNWTMLVIEKFPCDDIHEATLRERYWYELLNANMNTQVPSQSIEEYKKEYYIANKDAHREYKKEYYIANKDERREVTNEKARDYYNENKERINASEAKKEYKRQYYIANKERLDAQSLKNREANKDKINERCRELAKIKRENKTKN